jgi:methylation protein EvaC
MSFGRMPIAGAFIADDLIDKESFFELAPSCCDNCNMFQIVEQPDPAAMFHENYAFFSGTSRYMQQHFNRFAESVIDGHIAGRADPFVVELGSNDGIMLRHFKDRNIRHLGVEPSDNVAEVGRQQGIETLVAFFDSDTADRIVAEHGHADVVLAANVMCHIPHLPSVAKGIRQLLKSDGVLMFEDPYLGDVIAKTSYDQIYDEHVFVFSALSVSKAFETHGMELIDVVPQITHGGSMRYLLAPKGSNRVSPNVANLIAKEHAQGLDRADTYQRFKANCETSRDQLMTVLRGLREKRKRVVGYAATAKSATVTNYCGITSDLVEFISDTTPIKQGKLSPGAHIPVKPYEAFAANYPDYALLFAWNHSAEIREKEKKFIDAGGKWIFYVPKVEIVS